MQQVTGTGTPSAKPEGIPVNELTYGTAVGLAELVLHCADDKGHIEYDVMGYSDMVQTNIGLVTKVMPWGVLAASCVKLCTRIVGSFESHNDFKMDVWNETKRLIVHNAPAIARLADIEPEPFARYIQSFINGSVLPFLVGTEVKEFANPTILGSTEYEYAVVITTTSLALIAASANCQNVALSDITLTLKTELNGLASNAV
jgi:hypothetical protein